VLYVRAMRHPVRAAAAAALAAAVACKEPAPPPPQAPPPARAPAFTLRDLALATALDARLARLSLAAADLEAALAQRGAKAMELAAELEVAKGEVRLAAGAIAHPLDRSLATGAASRAAGYADQLLSVAREGSAPAAAQAAAAREALGGAIAGYRQARAAWRLDAPDPQGAEREFAEARRDMERAEASVARTGAAPREEGQGRDPAAVRMTGRMAVERARAAAERLPPATRGAAGRYASAQQRVLAAVAALAAAPDPEKARAARAYQAAKAEALAALADYFAALAAR
jgi:hypothetical protein